MNSTSPTDPQKTEAGQTPGDFKSLFCARFQCPPEQFEERALRKCLCWPAVLLKPLVSKMSPGFFERDQTLVRYMGSSPGRRHAMNELGGYMDTHEEKGGFVRKVFFMRISAKATSKLIKRVFGPRRGESGAAAGMTRQKRAV